MHRYPRIYLTVEKNVSVSVRPRRRLGCNISNGFFLCCFGMSRCSDSTDSTCNWVVDSNVFSTTLSDGKANNSFHSFAIRLPLPASGSVTVSWTVSSSSGIDSFSLGIWRLCVYKATLLRRIDWGVNSSMGGVNQLPPNAKSFFSVSSRTSTVIILP